MKKKIPCTLFVCCVSFLGLRLNTQLLTLPFVSSSSFSLFLSQKILRVKVDSMLLSKFPTLRTTATIQQNEEEEEKCIFRKFFFLAQRNNAMGMEWESFCLFPVVFTIFLTLSLFILGIFFFSISPFNGNHFVCFHCIHRWDRTIQFINTTRKYRAFN